jgi:hypothetical protein
LLSHNWRNSLKINDPRERRIQIKFAHCWNGQRSVSARAARQNKRLRGRGVARCKIGFNTVTEYKPSSYSGSERCHRIIFIQLRWLRDIYSCYCAYAALRMRSVSSADKHGDKRIRYRNSLHKSHYAKIIRKAYVAVN